MLLPSSSIDGTNAILHAVHGQFVGPHANDTSMLAMGGVGHCIVAFLVPLPDDPEISEDGDGPVSRWDVSEWVQEQRCIDEFKPGENCKQAKGQQRECNDCHCYNVSISLPSR